MMKYRNTVFFFIVLFLSLAVTGNVLAASSTTPPSAPNPYVRIFYYREGKAARASFLAHPSSIDIFAPQSYSLSDTGVLEGSIDSDLLAFAETYHIKVMPLVTNKAFSQDNGHAILDNSAAQDLAITSLVTEGLKEHFWGWQFDFEQMDASYKDKYSAFIQKVADAFKKNNLAISVAVVAQISENPADYPKNLWQRVVGVYDYAALGTSVDFVSVMTYDDPVSKGPVARFTWVQQVIQHSLKYIPKQKISLGIPLYYWKWRDATGKLVGIGGWDALKEAFAKYGAQPQYSLKQQAPYMTFVSKKIRYTIWYENARSVQQKINLINKYQLHGFSAWALGQEIPDLHRILKRDISAPAPL